MQQQLQTMLQTLQVLAIVFYKQLLSITYYSYGFWDHHQNRLFDSYIPFYHSRVYF